MPCRLPSRTCGLIQWPEGSGDVSKTRADCGIPSAGVARSTYLGPFPLLSGNTCLSRDLLQHIACHRRSRMVREYTSAARLGHAHEPILVRKGRKQQLHERARAGAVIEAMHTMLQKERPPITGAVDHGNGAGQASLIMSITIPSIALWRKHQPSPRERRQEFRIRQRRGWDDDTETAPG